MATIFYANGEIFFDTEHPSPDLAILAPKAKVETNRSGSASFTVLPTHYLHDSLEKMKTVITVEQDGEVIFRGRIIDMPSDLYGQLRVTCEGDMGFLLDSIQSPYTGTQTVAEFFNRVISNHNSMVETWKQFVVGEVSITERNQSKEFKIDGYQKTSDLLNSELLQEYGGIIRTRTENGVTYIDYVEDPFTRPNVEVNSQEIRFAVNLVDYDEQYPVNDIFTILIPIGRDNLTIADANGGSIYLESPAEVINKFGRIYHTEQWSNISSAAELKEAGQVFLNGHAREFPNDLKVRAIDVHNVKDSVERIKMGDSVRARIDPRGISAVYYCLSIDYDFVNPDNDEYWLGTFIPSDKQKGSTAETSYGGGGGGYGGESLSETSASTSAKANKQQQALQENEQNIRINAQSIDVLLTKTGASEIPDGSDSMWVRMQADHTKIETTASKTEGLETMVSTVKQTAEGVEAEVKAARNGEESLSARFAITAEAITEQVERVDDLGEAVATFQVTADEISSRVTSVEGQYSSISQRADGIESRVSTVEGQYSSISQRADGIESRVGTVEGQYSSIKQTVDSISLTGDTISIKGNTISLDGSTLVTKLKSQNVVFGTLSAGTTQLGNTTVSKLFFGNQGSSVYFYPYQRALSLVGSRGNVYAPGSDGSAINLDHAHELSEGSNGTIVVGKATQIGGSSATFSIASTNFYQTKIAEASSSVEISGHSWNPDTGICSIALTNGKGGTIGFPNVGLLVSSTWSAEHKKTVYITSTAWTNIGATHYETIDASDVYEDGYKEGMYVNASRVDLPDYNETGRALFFYPAQSYGATNLTYTYYNLENKKIDNKLYVDLLQGESGSDSSSSGAGYGRTVARIEVDTSALFTQATVTPQGSSETVYVSVEDDTQGATSYYQAGSSVTYYRGGQQAIYYNAGTRTITGRGTDVSVTKLGEAVKVTPVGNLKRMSYHYKTVTPTKNYYTEDSNGSFYFYTAGSEVTYYKKGSTDRYYVGNGGTETIQGTSTVVTAVGDPVPVTPIDTTKKLTLASQTRYRAGTPDSTTYYKKK